MEFLPEVRSFRAYTVRSVVHCQLILVCGGGSLPHRMCMCCCLRLFIEKVPLSPGHCLWASCQGKLPGGFSLGLVSVLHLSVLMPLLQRAGGWYWLHYVVILRVVVNLQLGLGFSKCWHFHVNFRNQHFGFSKGSIGIFIWAS